MTRKRSENMAVKMKRETRKHLLDFALEDFVEFCKEKGLAQASITTYEEKILMFVEYTGRMYVEDLTDEFVLDFRYWLKQNRHFNEVSTNTVYRCINIFLQFCADKYRITAFKIPFVKEYKKIKPIFDDEDIKRLTRKPNIEDCHYSELRDYICTVISLNTGARASSIVNVHKQDIDFKNKTITFRHAKNRRQFTIPVPKSVIDNIRWYLEIVEIEDVMFLNSLNEPLTAKQLSVSFRRYCINRGVKLTSYHTLRHWFATHLMMECQNIHLVSKALGHANVSTTERYLSTLGINSYSSTLKDIDLTRGLKG